MSTKLRDLISSIRQCKTASDERAVITQECANIRNAFKENDNPHRARCVAKLLFINMLGFPTHFGQMECLKLIASNTFSEKRVGYLGLSQLMDENSEILMLVTNSIKNDLDHPNQYINSLALSALGNITSVEMCRSLTHEVEEMMAYINPYVKKKASFCAMKLMRKMEQTDSKWHLSVSYLLQQRNHGLILSGCAILLAELEMNTQNVEKFRHFITILVQSLKRTVNLSQSQSIEYDIGGVRDPFLQCRLMLLLRLLAKDSNELKDEMSDILAQICTNTNGGKNVDNAVLYECVRTIVFINAEAGLLTLAINILGKFLSTKDINLKYISLCLLQHVVKIDMKAVQRHRGIIMDCLSDSDITIRRRALDVTFLLINEENIKSMTKDLLNCLLSSDVDFKGDIVAKMCMSLDRFSPSRRWHIDTLIKIMCLAGNFIQEEVRDTFVNLLLTTPDLRTSVVHKLFFSLKENHTQEALVQVAVWSIGEFGDLLLHNNVDTQNVKPITSSEVLDLLESVSRRPPSSSKLKYTNEFIITAITKLAVRFPSETNRIRNVLQTFETSMSIEIQQRACEFDSLLGENFTSYRSALFERLPITDNLRSYYDRRRAATHTLYTPHTPQKQGDVLDFLDDSPPTKTENSDSSFIEDLLDNPDKTDQRQAVKPSPPKKTEDILDELFASPTETSQTHTMLTSLEIPKTHITPQENIYISDDSNKNIERNTHTPSSSPTYPFYPNSDISALNSSLTSNNTSYHRTHTKTVYDENQLSILFELTQHTYKPTETHITAHFTNKSNTPMNSFVFEVAVPSYLELKMLPTHFSSVQPSHTTNTPSMQQKLIVNNTQNGVKKIVLRLRISYEHNSQQIVKLVTVGDLPNNL